MVFHPRAYAENNARVRRTAPTPLSVEDHTSLVPFGRARRWRTQDGCDETAERTAGSKNRTESAGSAAVGAESKAQAALEQRVALLERDLAQALQESQDQSGRAALLQQELDAFGNACMGGTAGGDGRGVDMATADIFALKAKATQLVERLRQEKMARLKSERDTRNVAEKVASSDDPAKRLKNIAVLTGGNRSRFCRCRWSWAGTEG